MVNLHYRRHAQLRHEEVPQLQKGVGVPTHRQAMADRIKLEVDTPDGTVYSESVEMVVLQGLKGGMKTIVPDNTPLIEELEPGEMIAHRGGHKDLLALGEGLVLVSNGLVAVVTNKAIAA